MKRDDDLKRDDDWPGWLGFRRHPDFRKARWLGNLIGTLALAAGAVILVATLVQFLGAATGLTDPGAGSTRHEAIRNIGLVLAAILGAPFVMWRSWAADKQARVAEESLFNDKINAAAGDLAARRQVTTLYGTGTARRVLTEWRDDLVTRAAAIDRLEGLVEERPEIAPRVARLLSIYVRELSADHPAQDFAGPGGDIDALKSWAWALKPARSDMEKAAQTLGRLKDIGGVTRDNVPIDLRGANLQGFDLHGLCFDKAQMQGARMEGANLFGARMEGADLWAARMQGADLIGARMEGANLWEARMEGADLRFARMEGADLRFARMEGADLSEARMEGANLGGARMEGADLREARMEGANPIGARMEGANLRGAQFDAKTDFTDAVVQYAAMKSGNYESVNLGQDQVNSLFGDGSVTLPAHLTRPAHWPAADLDWLDFLQQWRDWQRENGYTPPG